MNIRAINPALVLNKSLLLFLCLVWGQPIPAFDGECLFVLENVVAQNYRGKEPISLKSLTVFASFKNGRCMESWAYGKSFNVRLHEATITKASFEEQRIIFEIEIVLHKDLYVSGGKATAKVEFKRTSVSNHQFMQHCHLSTQVGKERLEGFFKGIYHSPYGADLNVAGNAEGIVFPLRQPAPDFQAVEPGEHPRLMFRNADKARLQERMHTPLGQAVMQLLLSSEHEVALGLRYQLLGDVEAAKKALEIVLQPHGMRTTGKTQGYGGVTMEHTCDHLAAHYASTAFVYDLCYQAWEPTDRLRIEEFLENKCEYAASRPWGYSNVGFCAVGSGTGANVYCGGSIKAMALYKKPGQAPIEPVLPGNLKGLSKWVDHDTFKEKYRLWEQETALWRQLNGQDLGIYRYNLHFQAMAYLQFIYGPGEGGSCHDRIMFDHALAYRSVHGVSPTGRPDIELAPAWFLITGNKTDYWGDDMRKLSRFLAIAAPSLQKSILKRWLKAADCSEDDLHTNEGAKRFLANSKMIDEDPWALFYVLKYLPLLTTNEAKVPTLDFMQRMQNGTLYLKSDSIFTTITAWALNRSDSGLLDLQGFGHHWIKGKNQADRFGTGIVMLPKRFLSTSGPGKMLWSELNQENGLAQAQLDLSAFYHEIVQEDGIEKSQMGNLYIDKPVKVWKTNNLGIKAFRNIAVDYSGLCGAPALFVIADRLDDGALEEQKEWVLNLANFKLNPALRNPPPKPILDITGNRFTVRQGNATLQGTVLFPENASIRLVDEQVLEYRRENPRVRFNPQSGEPFIKQRIELAVSGLNKTEGQFLVLLTLQEGEAPVVLSDRAAIDAVIKIGARRIRLVNDKFEFSSDE